MLALKTFSSYYYYINCRWFVFVLRTSYIVYLTMIQGAISYGSAVALLSSAERFKRHLSHFTELLKDFQENSLYIDRLRKFMNYEEKITDTSNAIPLILNRKENKGVFELKNISMRIGSNDKIAIVGYTFLRNIFISLLIIIICI